MNVKLRVLTAGVLFFTGQAVFAQKKDTAKNVKDIEEVVVLGYNKTSTKPKDVSASVTVSAEKLENRPNASFLNSLQGEAPGLSISSTSGSPGSSKIDVIIRGVSSLNASSDPLYVIDGMISNTVQFRNLNPNDIETVSVLKDAQATAIYGNRGANGVIVIRTKQGKYGDRFTVSYNGTVGFSFLPTTDYNMADSKQLLRIQRAYNNGLGAGKSDDFINNYAINTDWRKELFRTGSTQAHDVSMAFGGERVNNFTSIGYFEQTGTVPTTDFKRFTLRNNLNAKSKNNRFIFNSNMSLGYSKRHQLDQETSTTIDNNVVQNPLLAGITGTPLLDPNAYANGYEMYNGFGTSFDDGQGVYSLLDVLRGNIPNELTETSAVANFSATYKLTDELSVTNKSGIDYKYSTRNFARAPWAYLALAVANTSGREFPGIESFTNSSEFNFNSITSFNYNKQFGKHTIDAGVYFDYLKSHFKQTTQQQEGLNPLNWVFGAGSGYVDFNTNTPTIYRPTIGILKRTVGTLAYFGTIDYDFDSKYGISGTLRRDATFRFTDDNKWGTFWSVGGRWNIDKENFMEGSTFNMLKLRGSYGVIGNQNVIAAAYGTNPLYTGLNLIRNTLALTTGYNQINGALGNSVLANPLVQWEEVGQANVGLDFRLLKNKLEGSVDVYSKTTRKLYNDIFYTYAVGSNPQTGNNTIKGNNGKLSNKGIELMLKYNLIQGEKFKLSVYGNTAYNKGKVLESNITTGILRNNPGNMIGEWFLVDYIGVNQANGNLLFDVNGNQVERYDVINDLKGTGKSYLPKYTGGFGLNSSYKNFSLDVHFTYQADVWRLDNQMDYVYDITTVRRFNVTADLLNAWTPTNTNTNVPSLLMTNQTFGDTSTRFLKDASFIRMKNVVLGYSVPKEMLGDNIKGIKVFLQGENLLTFTKWRGYDPEPLFAQSTSVYPNMRTATLGVNIDF
ncbi:SusC/RagA family TonB-linked outer membrane protein [Chryseobacterium aquaticum]|uniref:SusC/RagA family TonB-linked outer membrane protein n=1 Tax=Chryseobacterium aquaticum TaxID=452084 RepID=UPI002FC6D0FF